MTITTTTLAALSTCAIEGNKEAQRALVIIGQWRDEPTSVTVADKAWLEYFMRGIGK